MAVTPRAGSRNIRYWAMAFLFSWSCLPGPISFSVAAERDMGGGAQDLAFDLSGGTSSGTVLTREDHLVLPEGRRVPGIWTSAPLELGAPFRQALLTWNGSTPPGSSLHIEARVGIGADWTPWMPHSTWIGTPPREPVKLESQAGSPSRARIDVDTLLVDPPGGDSLQVRLTLEPSPQGESPRVRFLPVAFASVKREIESAIRSGPGESSSIALDVPFRSQRWEEKAIASRICCPTSVAMVLQFHGVHRPTEEVAWRCFDSAHNLFGNWSFAAAAAGEFGMKARVAWIDGWNAARQILKRNIPIIASVRYGAGELDGSPMKNGTKGHLLVIRGLDDDGGVLVNDPAAGTVEAGQTVYRADQLLKAWRNGVAILIEPGGSGGH